MPSGILALLLYLSILIAPPAVAENLRPERSIAVWVWDYPQDLSFAGDDIEVVYYAGTVHIKDEQAILRARKKYFGPASVRARAIPALRLEVNCGSGILERNRKALVESVCAIVENKARAGEIQLDFDARESDMAFYRQVLDKLEKRGMRISITALASWVRAAGPLQSLAAREKVVMLFSLGKGRKEEIERLKRLEPALAPGVVGVSVYEKTTNEMAADLLKSASKIYLYSAVPWRPDSLVKGRMLAR